MLVTNYEWQSDSFRNIDDAQMATWPAVLVSFDTTPFLVHGLNTRDSVEPLSVLLESTEKLVVELTGHPDQTEITVDILSPTIGAQPVYELWSYRSRGDHTVFYAYVNQEGELAPCHPTQPQCMTELQRQFTFRRRERPGHEVDARSAPSTAIELPATIVAVTCL